MNEHDQDLFEYTNRQLYQIYQGVKSGWYDEERAHYLREQLMRFIDEQRKYRAYKYRAYKVRANNGWDYWDDEPYYDEKPKKPVLTPDQKQVKQLVSLLEKM